MKKLALLLPLLFISVFIQQPSSAAELNGYLGTSGEYTQYRPKNSPGIDKFNDKSGSVYLRFKTDLTDKLKIENKLEYKKMFTNINQNSKMKKKYLDLSVDLGYKLNSSIKLKTGWAHMSSLPFAIDKNVFKLTLEYKFL